MRRDLSPLAEREDPSSLLRYTHRLEIAVEELTQRHLRYEGRVGSERETTKVQTQDSFGSPC